MRLIWKGIRAVTVETAGVVAVVWMLFAAAGWTVESVGVEPKDEAADAWEWLQETARDVTASIKPQLDERDRQRYVEQRLDHYSRVYRQAASKSLKQAAQHLNREQPLADSAAEPTNRLLGSL